MSDLPDEMKQGKRQPDQVFSNPTEKLFRAIKPGDIEGPQVALDAIELPDMSVNRGKYDTYGNHLLYLECWAGCGVACLRVDEVPKELLHNGVDRYHFDVQHVPTQNNYAHSIIRALLGTVHIEDSGRLPHELHLRFRSRLRAKMKIHIRPGEFSPPGK